jgi:alkane 1-monooxygenase
MNNLKYLAGYIPILSACIGLYLQGIWSFLAVVVVFGIIPILEVFTPKSTVNLDESGENEVLVNRLFDWLLYLNVPLLYSLVICYFITLTSFELAVFEIVGMTLSVGIACGSAGINVAHELGHRKTRYEHILSQMLLLPEFYMHFYFEHNLGHHKNVATPEDPATSRFKENIYSFFLRSVTQSYVSAWKIQRKLLKRQQQSFFSFQNKMLIFQLIQTAYLLIIGSVFGWQMMAFAVAIGVLGFLLLETVNYVEHYGLVRQKLPSGKYEPVQPHHSWNSNHTFGRIVLYELTRHSDHHFKSSRKYQTLRHFDESPQLPYGYPASMLMALIPWLWFCMMNKEVLRFQNAK